VILVWYVVEYYRDPLHLRRFPAAHPTAGFSAAWTMVHCWKLKRFWGINKAHERVGPIVRIQPDHVSFNVGEAIEEIYGHGKDLTKAPFYDTLASYQRSMFDTTDRAEHGQKRKYVAHMFAPMTVKNLEEVVVDTTKSLFRVFDRHADMKQPEWLNMRHWISMYAFDIIGDLGFGEKLGCLQRGDDIMKAQTREGKIYDVSGMRGVYDGGAYNVFWGQASSFLKWTKWMTQWTTGRFFADAFFDVAIYLVKRRVPAEEVAEYEKNRRFDLFQRLVIDKKGKAMDLEFEELFAEAAVLMIAGSDTSGTGLCNTILYLAKHPDKLAKLQAEVDTAISPNTLVATHDDVKDLPYLRACIDESLRLRPPNAQGLPRTVSEKGATVQGYYMKSGTVVSVPTYSIHRNEKYFKNAEAFMPERWIDNPDEKETYNLKKYVIPFSAGSRACIGRNLAYLELQVALASIVHRYSFELKDAHEDVEIFERFNSNPRDFYVKVSYRTPNVLAITS
jgi:cytochrome P450